MVACRTLLAASLVALSAAMPARAAEGPGGEADATFVLALRPTATLTGDRVALRDLVQVVRDDEHLARLVGATDLGPAPRVGEPVRLQRAQIEAWLRQRRPAFASRLALQGPEVIELRRASQAVDTDWLEARGRAVLSSWLAARSDRYEVEPVHGRLAQDRDGAVQAGLEVLPGRLAATVRPLPAGMRPEAHMRLWIDLSVDGRYQRTVPVDYAVHAWRSGWTADADLQRGEDLDERRARASQVDLASLDAAPWTEPAGLARVRRPVHAGQVLTVLDVEPRPFVARGEQVAMMGGYGELSIQVNARALQDGRKDERIAVRVEGGTAPVMARVVRRGLVVVDQ